ncbi:MAG: matrixin family metalloprotease [Polyangiales bacterium]
MRPSLAIALLAPALLAPSTSAAWCRTTTITQSDPARCVEAGATLYWPVGCLSMSLDTSDAPPGMSAATLRGMLSGALNAWGATRCDGQPLGIRLSTGPDTTRGAEYVEAGENVNALVFVRDWRATGLASSALAVTTVTFGASTGVIRDADLRVNLSFPLTSSDAVAGNDLPTILLHEVGHVLGLDHSGERSAVMWFSAGRGERRRVLQPDDLAGACAAHPPTLQRPCAVEPAGGGCECATRGGAGEGGGGLWGAAVLSWVALRRRRRGAGGAASV